MYLNELLKKPTKEINKMSKADIIRTIDEYRYQYTGLADREKRLQEQLVQNRTDERAACLMLAAFVGAELPRDEYTGTIDNKKLNILELVGLVTKKCADIAR